MTDRDDDLARAEAAANRSRDDLARDTAELKERLSPGTLIDEGMSYLKGGGGERLMRAAQANPMALVLIGAGAMWLLQTMSRQSSHTQSRRPVRSSSPSYQGEHSTATPAKAPNLTAAVAAELNSDLANRKDTTGASAPGVMSDQSMAQDLNQSGDPSNRVTENEVKDTFGQSGSSSTSAGTAARY